ncbi:MAG: hypothetical protein ACR2I1_11275 [Propionibacteriaceae bacterium]
MITAILLGAAHAHVNYLLAEVAATSDLTVVAAADPDRANRSTLLAQVGADTTGSWQTF